MAPGSRGADAFRRIAAVQAIAPGREDAHRQAGFGPDDSDRSRGRDNREVRQLAIRPGHQSDPGPRPAVTLAEAPAARRPELQGFGAAPFASIQFLAQVIGQAEDSSGGLLAYHPDGAALGSDAYRRAGAAPPHYSEAPTVFRVAI